MQYLLTKEEYENLVPKNKYEDVLEKLELLNQQVLHFTKNQCWHNDACYRCDFCPVLKTCTKEKKFSK